MRKWPVFFEMIVAKHPSPGSKRRIVTNDPNYAAVALLLLWEDGSAVLLGSDVEEQGQSSGAWSSIVDSDERPMVKSDVLKVPHHGSERSHCDRLYSELCKPQSLAIMAPFVLGRVKIPTAGDQVRIKSLVSSAYLTAPNKLVVSRKSRPRVVISWILPVCWIESESY